MLSKSAFGIAAAGAGLCFLGYCIYFDHKRRSDPDFKKKLREKRRIAKQGGTRGAGQTKVPDFKDSEAMQRFFMQEVQLGEELLAAGEIESGIEHLGNAVAVCGTPQQFLQLLQQTLPPQVFQLLLQRLPNITQKISSAAASPNLHEDDVE